jgi:hypothetical protein
MLSFERWYESEGYTPEESGWSTKGMELAFNAGQAAAISAAKNALDLEAKRLIKEAKTLRERYREPLNFAAKKLEEVAGEISALGGGGQGNE